MSDNEIVKTQIGTSNSYKFNETATLVLIKNEEKTIEKKRFGVWDIKKDSLIYLSKKVFATVHWHNDYTIFISERRGMRKKSNIGEATSENKKQYLLDIKTNKITTYYEKK